VTYDQLIQTVLGGLAIGCIYSLIALGISMIIRATDILHFAQGEMMMIGAMAGLTATWLRDMPFVLVLLFGMIGGGLAAATVEVLAYRTLRVRGVPLVNVVIATLGISIMMQNGARVVWGSQPLAYPPLFTSAGITVGGFVVSPQLLWIVVLSIAIMGALMMFFRFTLLGLAMQAAAQDPDAARLMGISVERTTTLTFAVSGMMAGAAGVLLGSLFFASFNMGFTIGIKAFVAATLGGLGSMAGALVGGLMFGLIETFAGMVISTSYKDAIGMVVLIVILLFMPMGLFGRASRQV
jgi:branched-subunit amino acid ABC-type transport system permease component